MSSYSAKTNQVPETTVAIYPHGLSPLPTTFFIIHDLSSAAGIDGNAGRIEL